MSFNRNSNLPPTYNASGTSMYWTGLPSQRSANIMPTAPLSMAHSQNQGMDSAPGNSTDIPVLSTGYAGYPTSSLLGPGMLMTPFSAPGNTTGTMFPGANSHGFNNLLPGYPRAVVGYSASGNTTANAYPAPQREPQRSQSTAVNNHGVMSHSQGPSAQNFAPGGSGMPTGMSMQPQRALHEHLPHYAGSLSQETMGQGRVHSAALTPINLLRQPVRMADPVAGQYGRSQRSMEPASTHGAYGISMNKPQRVPGWATGQYAASQGTTYHASTSSVLGTSTAAAPTPRRERSRQLPVAGVHEVISLDHEETVPTFTASGSSSGTLPASQETPKKAAPRKRTNKVAAPSSKKRKAEDDETSPRQQGKKPKKSAAGTTSDHPPPAVENGAITPPRDASLGGAHVAHDVPDTTGTTTREPTPPAESNPADNDLAAGLQQVFDQDRAALKGAHVAPAVSVTTGTTTSELAPPPRERCKIADCAKPVQPGAGLCCGCKMQLLCFPSSIAVREARFAAQVERERIERARVKEEKARNFELFGEDF